LISLKKGGKILSPYLFTILKGACMKKYEPDAIRNLGIFSHGGEGKTSVVESILFLAGENTRLGKVDEGTSLMDYEPEEIDRKATISSSIASFEWNKHKINFIDTPGDDNFIYDAKLCMRVVDAAAIVVGAVSGVRVGTEKVWDYTNEFAIPVGLFVNKMDRERADFARTVEDLRRSFTDKSLVVVQIPVGGEEKFRGVIDLVAMKAYLYRDDQSGAFEVADVPAELAEDAAKYREKMIETAVEMDDEVMERYLNGDEIDNAEVERCLKEGIWNRKLVPIMCGSAGKNMGMQPLIDNMIKYFPPPLAKGEVEGTNPKTSQTVKRKMSADQPFSA
jgi:elongation factor G